MKFIAAIIIIYVMVGQHGLDRALLLLAALIVLLLLKE